MPEAERKGLRSGAKPPLVSAAGSYDSLPPNPLLVAYLDEAGRRAFVDSMMEVEVHEGDVIMRAGDKGNNYYLVKEGALRCVADDGKVRAIGVGGGVGEYSLLTGRAREATVTVESSSARLLMAHRKAFNKALGAAVAAKRTAWAPFLARISIFSKAVDLSLRNLPRTLPRTLHEPFPAPPPFQDLSEAERALVADALTPVRFAEGELLSSEGERAERSRFLLIKEGSVRDESGGGTLGPGDYFGEVEILQKRPYSSHLI